MKLTGITVGFEPNADVSWEGIRAYAIAKTIPDHEIASATNTPEAKAYIQNLLQPKIKAGVEQAMVGQLNGPRPVRLDVVVKRFAIASAVQRILIGGNHVMVATATLVDARTGAAIITYPDLVAQVVVGQGIVGTAVQAAIDSAMPQTTTERLIAEYGRSYRTLAGPPGPGGSAAAACGLFRPCHPGTACASNGADRRSRRGRTGV